MRQPARRPHQPHDDEWVRRPVARGISPSSRRGCLQRHHSRRADDSAQAFAAHGRASGRGFFLSGSADHGRFHALKSTFARKIPAGGARKESGWASTGPLCDPSAHGGLQNQTMVSGRLCATGSLFGAGTRIGGGLFLRAGRIRDAGCRGARRRRADTKTRRYGASPQFAAALAEARLFVGNDSGPAHMAAALGRPLVVIFGSSSSPIWGPWQPQAAHPQASVVQNKFECNPCPGDHCYKFAQPECILSITFEQVKAAVERSLDKKTRVMESSRARTPNLSSCDRPIFPRAASRR